MSDGQQTTVAVVVVGIHDKEEETFETSCLSFVSHAHLIVLAVLVEGPNPEKAFTTTTSGQGGAHSVVLAVELLSPNKKHTQTTEDIRTSQYCY